MKIDIKKELELLKNFDSNNLKDINSIWSWPVLVKILVVLSISLLIILGSYFYVFKTMINEVESSIKKESELIDNINIKSIKFSQLEDLKSINNNFRIKLNSLLRILPLENEIPDLIDTIILHARANNINITNVNLEKEIIDSNIVTIPINMNISAEYHDLANFISFLSNTRRIIKINTVTLNGAEDGTINANIRAETYRVISHD